MPNDLRDNERKILDVTLPGFRGRREGGVTSGTLGEGMMARVMNNGRRWPTRSWMALGSSWRFIMPGRGRFGINSFHAGRRRGMFIRRKTFFKMVHGGAHVQQDLDSGFFPGPVKGDGVVSIHRSGRPGSVYPGDR